MTEIYEDELRAAIEKAVGTDPVISDEFPKCDPGQICNALLRHRYGLTEYQADSTINKMFTDGRLRRAWIIYHDPWGSARRTKGYEWVNGKAPE